MLAEEEEHARLVTCSAGPRSPAPVTLSDVVVLVDSGAPPPSTQEAGADVVPYTEPEAVLLDPCAFPPALCVIPGHLCRS